MTNSEYAWSQVVEYQRGSDSILVPKEIETLAAFELAPDLKRVSNVSVCLGTKPLIVNIMEDSMNWYQKINAFYTQPELSCSPIKNLIAKKPNWIKKINIHVMADISHNK